MFILFTLPFNLLFAQDGTKGPTLIITSALSGDYHYSKTSTFQLSNYKLIKVGTPTNTTDFLQFQYLDDAIEKYLSYNFQHIIILEGTYYIDGPIKIDNTNGSSHINATGNITIEGEGFGTKINPATGYTGNIFEVKTHYNTIKNLAIHIEGTGTGIYVAQDSTTGADTDSNGSLDVNIDCYHNTFENLYIGHKALYGTTEQTDVAARGIVLDGQYKDVGYNKFSNIVIKGLHTGITFKKGAISPYRIHDNVFTNVNFARVVRGVFFDSANLQETVDGQIIYDDITDMEFLEKSGQIFIHPKQPFLNC